MKKANLLINEKSPYLLQHAYNPVNWFPWSDEAFKKARDEEKPVFVSIGYSTCHWCHVMEKESFEDDEVAKLLNKFFISIKVDREERPDIDGIYMTACQILTGSGGWPLTIIMTPEKKPFFAGTYFPKDDRFGKMGLINLLPRIHDAWKHRRNEIYNSANEISNLLIEHSTSGVGEDLDEKILDKAFNSFEDNFDSENGGFGTAPKFPTPHNLLFLLRYSKRKNSFKALEMVEKTLTKMYEGGIYDHIGFGFHRYSTDEKWLAPHFEKMLYDQALLTIAYIEAFQATKKTLFKKAATEILEYVKRELTSQEGGFFCAEDADSEGEEGKFYLWTKAEIEKILKPEEAEQFCRIYNVKHEGNWHDHTGKTGTNILHIVNYKESDQNNAEKELSENIREKLFKSRLTRVPPFKDTKILTDWNSLMISAFAKASQVFNSSEYYQTAEKAVLFILNYLKNKDGRLLHRFRQGESGIPANADDYSFLIAGLIDLYEAGFNYNFLNTAIDLNNDFIKFFWDEKNGGFFFSPLDGETLLFRQKELYDGAVPSGNSVAILNLLRLGRITGNPDSENKASEIIKAFSKVIKASPGAFTQSLIALDFAFGPSKEIIITGNKDSSLSREFQKIIWERFIPNKVVLLYQEENDGIENVVPLLRQYKNSHKKPIVYICENYICNKPVDNVDELKEFL